MRANVRLELHPRDGCRTRQPASSIFNDGRAPLELVGYSVSLGMPCHRRTENGKLRSKLRGTSIVKMFVLSSLVAAAFQCVINDCDQD